MGLVTRHEPTVRTVARNPRDRKGSGRILEKGALLLVPLLAQAIACNGGHQARREAIAPDFRPQIEGYVALVHHSYEGSLAAVLELKGAVSRFLKEPTAAGLEECRDRWLAAREPYGWTEAFRFSEGPIDIADLETGLEGPEERINGWPVNEAYIDSVEKDPKSGIINDVRLDLEEEFLRERNAFEDETAILCGFHAIEFLLWGQDLDPGGRERRSHLEYSGRGVDRVRRSAYLRLVTGILEKDLRWLVNEWRPDRTGNYAERFRALEPREALRRILTGVATLAGFELAAERIAVPLQSGSQEDEQSCFSDSTHRDLLFNVQGIDHVYTGSAGTHRGAGLDQLVRAVDPDLDRRLRKAIDGALELAGAVPPPFDAILMTPRDGPDRAVLKQLEKQLQEIARLFQELGSRLGIVVIVSAQ